MESILDEEIEKLKKSLFVGIDTKDELNNGLSGNPIPMEMGLRFYP